MPFDYTKNYPEDSLPDPEGVEGWDYPCFFPVLAKYVNYAMTSSKTKPPDWMVEDLYKAGTDLIRRIDEKYNGVTPCGTPKEEVKLWYGDIWAETSERICNLKSAFDNAKTREDKVVAIEKMMSERHYHGPLLEYACRTPIEYLDYERALTDAVLNILAEEIK